MRRTRFGKTRENRGITLLEVMIVMAILFLLTSIAIPLYANALRQAREKALVADCRDLFGALTRYYVDHGAYPSESDLDTQTLSPLSTQEYLSATTPFTRKLEGNRLTFYFAPDVDGEDQQFIVVARHARDLSIIVAVVSTDIIDEDGDWIEGVFVITEEELEEADL